MSCEEGTVIQPAVERRQGRPTTEEAVLLREKFLNQAFAMLVGRGVYGFSIDHLAKASGVTKRTIYRHFATKTALIEAVVEREVSRLFGQVDLDEAGSALPLDRLRVWGKRFFDYRLQPDAQRLALFLEFESMTNGWAAEMLDRWARTIFGSARAILIAAQERGDLRTCEPDILLVLLVDLLDGVSNRFPIKLNPPIKLVEPRQQFERRWTAFLQLAGPDWSGEF